MDLSHSRFLDIAEPRPLDLKPSVGFQRNISDFRPNVLALTITVRPDKQSRSIASS